MLARKHVRDGALDHALLVEGRNEHADERLGIDGRARDSQLLPGRDESKPGKHERSADAERDRRREQEAERLDRKPSSSNRPRSTRAAR